MIASLFGSSMPEDTIFVRFEEVSFQEAERCAFGLAIYLRAWGLPSVDIDIAEPSTESARGPNPILTIRLSSAAAIPSVAKGIAAWLSRSRRFTSIRLEQGNRWTIERHSRDASLRIERFLSKEPEVRQAEPFEPAAASAEPEPAAVEPSFELESVAEPSEHDAALPRPTYAAIQLFYATDRKSTGQSLPAIVYGKERSSDGTLSLGVCEVSIPRDHRMGALEHPSIWRLEFQENPEKHVVLMTVTATDNDQFWVELSSRLGKSRSKEAFVFVHGYNTTFEDAARRTGQIAYDLGFDGAPICYTWPSSGELADYPKDETNAQWTVPHLKQFLQQIAENSGATTIHIIAHSMGNRAVSHALQLLSSEEQTKPCRLRHVVLTAPDIDADTFKELADAIKSVSDHVTLYVSPFDKALSLSKRFHGYPRLGEVTSVFPGIDTIDASSVDTSFIGHSYYAENRSVLSDIFWLLKDGKPPMERFGMQIVQDGTNVYYVFRP